MVTSDIYLTSMTRVGSMPALPSIVRLFLPPAVWTDSTLPVAGWPLSCVHVTLWPMRATLCAVEPCVARLDRPEFRFVSCSRIEYCVICSVDLLGSLLSCDSGSMFDI